jgi:hypothetical protein
VVALLAAVVGLGAVASVWALSKGELRTGNATTAFAFDNAHGFKQVVAAISHPKRVGNGSHSRSLNTVPRMLEAPDIVSMRHDTGRDVGGRNS